MERFKKLVTLGISIAVLFLFGACGGEKSGVETDKNEVNTYLGSGIKTLDISKATDANASFIFTQVMEGLTRVSVDERGQDIILPGLAESWETSEDGLVWTFYLRDSKWWDGSELTAEDFVYSIKRTLDPATASQYAFILSPIKNAMEYNSGKAKADDVGVAALDEKTLQFTLKSPTGYFLDLTYYKTLHPQRRDVVEKYGDRYGATMESLIANGPFVVKEWIPNNKVTLVKNENYWDKDNVRIDQVNVQVVQDTNAQMNMLLNGQLDIAGVSKQEWVKKFEETGRFNVVKGYTAGSNYTFFNLDDGIFKNDKIRKAFSLSITREDMGDVIFKGIFESAYGWVPPKIQIAGKEFRSEVPEPLKQLKDESPDPRELLAEGLRELGMDENPENLRVSYLNTGTNDWSRTFFEYIQQMWKKTLGVEIEGIFVEWPVFQKMIDEKDYQLAGMAWIGDYNDPSTFLDIWKSDAGIYNTGFKNDRYDELIEMAGVEVDQEKRLEYFREAENILLYEESAIAPSLYRKRNTFISKRLGGITIPLFGGMDYKTVYIVEDED